MADAVVTLVFVCCFHLHLAPEVRNLCTLTKKWMAAKCQNDKRCEQSGHNELYEYQYNVVMRPFSFYF